MGPRDHLASFPTESWDPVGSGKTLLSKSKKNKMKNKCILEGQGIPTRIEQRG